ncbi:MAG: CBS domain-containing protein [archaeon]|nr:CBS domain-containing protein [archaeon]
MEDAAVADYMVRDLISVEPQMTVKEVTEKMVKSDFDDFPISERGYLLGFVTAKGLLEFRDRPDATMREVMRRSTVCVVPSMKISDAMRVLFRYNLGNLPVVDENKKIIGIISNIDILRSHIERSIAAKAAFVKSFMESCNELKFKEVEMDVPITHLLPSQKNVYMDELIGRQSEIKRGLCESLIVIERRKGYLIVDGHHRVLAAKKLGLEKFRAKILKPDNLDVSFGLERTAEKWGLHTLDDVKIVEESRHPFIKVITMPLPDEGVENINKRLEESK